MASWTFWSLPCTCLLIVTACQPVRSDDASEILNKTIPECPLCITTDCWVDTGTCDRQCQDQCEVGFYRVHLLITGECTNKYDDAVKWKMNVPLSDEQVIPSKPMTVYTTEKSTVTVASTSTTPKPIIWLCKKCSQGCVRCRDNVDDPICETCSEGYSLDNATYTCTANDSEGTLSAAVIAGIIITVLCLVGIGALGVFVLCRRFHRSRDLSHANEKVMMAPVANERFGWSRGSETAEVEELPIAPGRPENNSNQYTDMHPSYDMLAKGDQVEQSSYAPLNQSREDLYVNNTTIQTGSNYANSQPEANNQPPHAATRQESGELYEDVAVRLVEDDSDHIYGNNLSSAPFQTVIETTEEIYINNCEDIGEDIYQNT